MPPPSTSSSSSGAASNPELPEAASLSDILSVAQVQPLVRRREHLKKEISKMEKLLLPPDLGL